MLTLLLIFSTASLVFGSSLHYEFSKYLSDHSKQYHSIDEYNYRLRVFSNNIKKINDHNQQQLGWTMKVNQWADQTWEEFTSNRLANGFNEIDTHFPISSTASEIPTAIPDSLDWRDHGVVAAVKNQGSCGSCWAFSAVSAIESAIAIKTGVLRTLSEQQLVDCDDNGDMGCYGGLMTQAFTWVSQNGLCSESGYPYTAENDDCKQSCVIVAYIGGYRNVPSNNETALKYAVAMQPISVAIEADQSGFQFYHSGVFSGACGTNLNHGVTLIGYGSENGEDYWLVRNSWGEEWGDKGYIKLKRSDGIGPGQCGIAMMASYPTV